MDERPIYEYGLELLARKCLFHCMGLFLPMCPGVVTADMHASDPPANRIDLFLSRDEIRARLEQAAVEAPAQFARLSEYFSTLLCPLVAALGAGTGPASGHATNPVDTLVETVSEAQKVLQAREDHA